jgi:hypothetical protein
MSYTSQQFLLFDNSSNANFQNWAGAIDAAILAMGWTLTSDTGQTAPASATVPATAAFIYRVYQPADILQTGATAFYLKVRYGTSSGTPVGPRVQFQIGTSTDGAGNLTGLTTANFEPFLTTSTGQGSVVTFDSYFSGDTDRLGIMMWRSGTPFIFTCERTKNTDGTNSSEGVSYFACGQQNVVTQQTIIFGVGLAPLPTAGRTTVTFADGANASSAFNNNISVFSAVPVYGKVGNPATVLCFVHTQDIAEGLLFPTTLYGATRTYIATGLTTTTNPSSTNFKACMRYD